MLTQAALKEVLYYDPNSGIFTWTKDLSGRFARVGAVAGSWGGSEAGYRSICISGRRYYAHRLAWLYMTGAWPVEQVDHIDRDRANNRWRNLRAASHAQNMTNRGGKKKTPRKMAGAKGVYYLPEKRKWWAKITVEGRQMTLGRFATEGEAIAARQLAEEKYRSAFLNTIGGHP